MVARHHHHHFRLVVDVVRHVLFVARCSRRLSGMVYVVSVRSKLLRAGVINGVASHVIHVMCSVPQGSVLGKLLFILYMADLADIAAQYNLTLHAFADDNQPVCYCY